MCVHDLPCLALQLWYVLLDFFLPICSLSTVSSVHFNVFFLLFGANVSVTAPSLQTIKSYCGNIALVDLCYRASTAVSVLLFTDVETETVSNCIQAKPDAAQKHCALEESDPSIQNSNCHTLTDYRMKLSNACWTALTRSRSHCRSCPSCSGSHHRRACLGIWHILLHLLCTAGAFTAQEWMPLKPEMCWAPTCPLNCAIMRTAPYKNLFDMCLAFSVHVHGRSIAMVVTHGPGS
jgi:hypothetical protein